MKPASLLRWYPRAWRERYGEEFLALIQDSVDEGRPAWRLRLSVIRGGLRERSHQAGRAGKAAVKRLIGPVQWWTLFVTGLVLAWIPETLTASAPQERGWQTAAVDGVLAAVILTGIVVLAGGLAALPALVRFLRAGGWPRIRRPVMRATGATVMAGALLAGLTVISGARSPAQLNSSWPFSGASLAAGVAMAVAIGLWADAAVATAKHLTLAPRIRAIQVVLGAVIQSMASVMFVALTLWWSATQSSVFLLAMSLANLAAACVLAPGRIGRAVRKGRRLRAADIGAATVNPSAQRTHGRHRA